MILNSNLINRSDWQKYEHQIKNEAKNILSSKFFINSDRTKSLMEYLINNNLEFPEEQISPYQIAKDIFKRGDDFDPSIDPIVRVQMARIRIALERYNNTVSNEIIIHLPKRSYKIEVYKRDNSNLDLTIEVNSEKLELTPAVVWFEPISLPNDVNGNKGKSLTNILVESLRNVSYYKIAGVRPWAFLNIPNVQLVISLSIENSIPNDSYLLNIMLLSPDDLSVLWQNRVEFYEYENDTSELEKIINVSLGCFWGDLTKQIEFSQKLPWINKLHSFLYNEEIFSDFDKVDEIHSLFNEGEGIENWDISQTNLHSNTYTYLVFRFAKS